MQPYGGVLVIEIYCQGYTSRWRKQGNQNILASVNQEEESSCISSTLLDYGGLSKKISLFVYVHGLCVSVHCPSSAMQVQEQNSVLTSRSFVVVLWRKQRKWSWEPLNWPWTLEKQPAVRGKVTVIGRQRALTDTMFAVMQCLLYSDVCVCVHLDCV